MEKIGSDGPKGDTRGFFPTNPDLADILGRMDLDFDNFYLLHFLDPKFLDFQVPRSPNFQFPRFPDAPPPPDELSDPNLTLLPTHPGTKYVARALAATRPSSARATLRSLLTDSFSYVYYMYLICLPSAYGQIKLFECSK